MKPKLSLRLKYWCWYQIEISILWIYRKDIDMDGYSCKYKRIYSVYLDS